MALDHAYLIKGFVLAHNPPQPVMEAINAVIACLEDLPIQTITGDPLVDIQLDLGPEDATGEDAAVSVAADSAPGTPAKPRKKHGWSEEARAAQAERMRARRAAGLMGRKKATPASPAPSAVATEGGHFGNPEPEPTVTPEFSDTELRITVPAPRRKSLLTDANWPEIKAMLAAGRSHRAIASDFDEEMEDLEFFIASNQRREAKHPPGESGASPSSVTSGATGTATW